MPPRAAVCSPDRAEITRPVSRFRLLCVRNVAGIGSPVRVWTERRFRCVPGISRVREFPTWSASISGRQRSGGSFPAPRCRITAADEDGSFIIFSLFIFMVMIMIGGLAVDVMRYEKPAHEDAEHHRPRRARGERSRPRPPRSRRRTWSTTTSPRRAWAISPITVDVEESTVGDDVIGRTVFVTSQCPHGHLLHAPDGHPRPSPCR